MAPPPGSCVLVGDDDDLAEFLCGLCTEVVWQPVTLPCCGHTFCRGCLEGLLISKLRAVGVCSCPAAVCRRSLSPRLPATNFMLEACLKAIAPDEVERRGAELQGTEDREVIQIGQHVFKQWQEVKASRILACGLVPCVDRFEPGVVLGASSDGRISVKFDTRMDEQVGVVNVTPNEIVAELPSDMGFHIGQRVAAVRNLNFGPVVGVFFGVHGTVMRLAGDPQRIVVHFDSRADGSEDHVNVMPDEIAQARILGFSVAQRVRAARDLEANGTILVRRGTLGIVQRPFSETRLIVGFDEGVRSGGVPTYLNVSPIEICRVD